WKVGLHAIIDKDSLIDLNAASVHQVYVGPNTGRDDHEVGLNLLSVGQGETLPAVDFRNALDGSAQVKSDALVLEPALHEPSTVGVEHARQSVSGDFDHAEFPAALAI